jgi:hypothetical protein
MEFIAVFAREKKVIEDDLMKVDRKIEGDA